MTPTITSSIVRPGANAESKVEYVNPNAVVRGNAIATGIPFVERNLFIAPEGQQYLSNLKITTNSIAEASATPAELEAVTRALPASLQSITFPRTLLQPSEEAVLIGFINELDTQVTNAAVASAAGSYARTGQITSNADYLLNDIA